MPKKKHWFFTVKGKGGCPPDFATGVDGDLTISGTSWVNLSSIPKASTDLVWQFDNIFIDTSAWLAIDVGTGTELVQIICKTSFDLLGSIVTTGGPIPSSSYNGWENNGSSVSGTTVSGYSYSASIVQNGGGAGSGSAGNGGIGTNGYGGGGAGGGGAGSGPGGANNAPGSSSSAPGGAGDSTQVAGATGGSGSPTQDCTFGGTSGPGGAGGGSGGGGGVTSSVHHPATHDKITIPAWDECFYAAGGGGGGQKGGHGGYLFVYFCGTITPYPYGGGRIFAFGDDGYAGGAAGSETLPTAGGAGGGAGGSGGHIWLECEAHIIFVNVPGHPGGAGGSGGGGSGTAGANGNAGTFTYIPI